MTVILRLNLVSRLESYVVIQIKLLHLVCPIDQVDGRFTQANVFENSAPLKNVQVPPSHHPKQQHNYPKSLPSTSPS